VAHFHLAAALAFLGRLSEARAAAKDGLALDPYFTRRRFLANPMSDNPTFIAAEKRISKGMRMAGVPEGDVGDGSNATDPVCPIRPPTSAMPR